MAGCYGSGLFTCSVSSPFRRNSPSSGGHASTGARSGCNLNLA